jgi:hypothetical protein
MQTLFLLFLIFSNNCLLKLKEHGAKGREGAKRLWLKLFIQLVSKPVSLN